VSVSDRQVDPITFEVLRNAFVSVCNEMALVVEMAAYSQVISEGRDFSGTLYDRDGHLVAQGEQDLPGHVGTVQFTVTGVIEHIGTENMRPGDVYMMNDPFIGGTHNNDIRLVKPIFREAEIVGYVATSGHWTDVGGTVPGSFFITATENYQEGVRIPPVLIARDGEVRRDVLELLLANMRVSRERRGDFNAQHAACNAGERRLIELIDKYSLATVEACMKEAQDYAERLFRSEIAKLPDGSWSWEEFVDQDISTGEPQRVFLTLSIEGDQILYDFTGTAPVAGCAINCTYSGLVSCLFITTKALFSHIPMNYGLLRSMDIVAPPDSLVNARHPAPVGGMAATSFERIIACVLGVCAEVAPERTIAGTFNLINITYGGRDKATGEEYVGYIWTEGGIGARATKDGLHGILNFYGGSSMNMPVEIQERGAPIFWTSYGFRPDSCGAGEFQGGVGSLRVLHVEREGLILSSIGDRSRFPPLGLFGGKAALTQGISRVSREGEEEDLGVFFANRGLREGDTIDYFSTGGGGYGPPALRDVRAILADVRDEYVSVEFVAREYGVVVEARDWEALDLRVDLEATHARRTELFGAEHADVPGAGELAPEERC
jgi:N-methylhydantoinase B